MSLKDDGQLLGSTNCIWEYLADERNTASAATAPMLTRVSKLSVVPVLLVSAFLHLYDVDAG